MAKRDFLTGVLQGLYQGGVGNPAVQDQRRRSMLEEAQVRQKMDADAAAQGMVPDPELVNRTRSFVEKFAGALFPGSETLKDAFPRYKPDPNLRPGYVTPTGDLSSTESPDAIRLNPMEYKDVLKGKAKQPIYVTQQYDAEGNSVATNPLKRGQKPAGIVRPQKESAASAQAKSDGDAKSRVSDNLRQMKSLYDKLDEMGSIVNTESGGFENVARRISSSAIGQASGRAMGTKSQSIRNQINQIKPLLIQDIRQASKMGARGLDSEKELAFYLQAATDPSNDIQANLSALRVLDRAYGLGLGLEDSGNGNDTLRTINSQAEYDALSPGEEYVDSAGNKARKR